MQEQGAGDSMPPDSDEVRLIAEEEINVKITSRDTKIEMGKDKKEAEEGDSFKGLNEEELEQYAKDPFWVVMRWALFLLFWVFWLAMVAAAVVIIVYAPKCPSPRPKQWWQKAPVYKMDVSSFPHHDLAGVEQELDYLVSLGVGSVYLASLISASDMTEVRRELGTLGDWARLVKGLQERGIKVIVDFVTIQTLQQHGWLVSSGVKAELRKVVEFWLHEGVDGFVIQAEDEVPETLMEEFRDILDAETVESGVEKILMTEGGIQRSQAFSSLGAGSVVHLSLPGDLLGPDLPTARGIKDKLDTFLTSLPEGAWPAFTLDTVAHGEQLVDALTMLKMLLPGTVIWQAGQELGLAAMDFSRVEGGLEKQHLQLYRLLATKLRQQDGVLFGDMTADNTFVMGEVFGLTRVKKGSPGYILVINLGLKEAVLDLSDLATVPRSIRVLEGGAVMAVSPRQGEEGKRFDSKEVALAAGQAKIFNFVPKF